MKTQITYSRQNPSTVLGECLKVEISYSSFNKEEIDRVEEYYKQNIGYSLITDDKTI